MKDYLTSTVLGFGFLYLICYFIKVDWQLMLMAYYTATHGSDFVPLVEFTFSDLDAR